jgi:hypothetical protein
MPLIRFIYSLFFSLIDFNIRFVARVVIRQANSDNIPDINNSQFGVITIRIPQAVATNQKKIVMEAIMTALVFSFIV